MKKALSFILCLILVLGCFPLTAMADDTTIGDGDEASILLTTTVPELASITVTPPTKTQYNVGDELDKTGMAVTANYTDESTKDVTSSVTLSGFDSSAAGEVTVTVSYTEGEKTVTATFSVTIVEPVTTTYTISISADPSEGGTVSGGGEYAENASVTVTATANENYSFVKWTENGEQVSADASYTFNATANRALVAVFEADEVIYTVTVQPGEGTGTAFTVQSTTILSYSDMVAGNYDGTKGCFFRYDGEDAIWYRFPTECPFTAPDGKELDCWECSFGLSFDAGTFLPIANYGSFTMTALWKEPEADPYVTLSIPATINIKYGDTQTAFDIQVKEASFTHGTTYVEVDLKNSSFTCTSQDGTIPFTVTTNAGEDIVHGNVRDGCYFAVHDADLPYSCQAFINITSDAWAAAKPGSYTAAMTLRVVFG